MKKMQTKKAKKHFFQESLRKILGVFLAVMLVATTFISLQVKNVDAATPEYYTVSYNPNGGTTAPIDPNQYTAGSVATIISSGSMIREGCNFAGWGTSPDGGTIYQPGSTITITGNVTLYATWYLRPASSTSYAVYYDPNGGTGGPATERGYGSDETVIVSSGKPTRSGDTFLYWTTQANGGGARYNGGDVFGIRSDVTLYAQWKSGTGAQTNTSRRSSATVTSSTPIKSSSSQSSSSESISSEISSEVIESESSSLQSETSLESSSNNSSTTSSSSGIVTVTVLPPAELLVKLKELNVPTFFSVPLHNAGLPGTWSLFSLLTMIITVIASIIVMVKIGSASKKNSDEFTNTLKTSVLSVLSILLGPLTALLFLLLQHFSSLMVFFNSYSIWFGIFFVLQIVFLILLAKGKVKPTDEDFTEYEEEYDDTDDEDDYID